jgi:hypothetical protein
VYSTVTISQHITNLSVTIVTKGITDGHFCKLGTYFTCPEVGPTIQNIKMQCKLD